MKALRTPDEAFTALPDFPWQPHYHEWRGLRMARIDEGAGAPVVLFHGEPTWSFLYRKVIPPLLAAGHRVVAPDYFGFGRSDKPTDQEAYTYARHVESMIDLVETLDLTGATAVVQDWGGPIGLRVATQLEARFDRLVIMNTGLFTGRVPNAFLAWRSFVEQHPDLPVERVMLGAAVTSWPPEVLAAYTAPFPGAEYKMGAWRFPLIVPLEQSDPGAAEMMETRAALAHWEKPTQVLFATLDPIFSLRTGERWVEQIPGARELETVEEAGHFLQEDQGDQVGARIASFLSGR